VRDLLFLSSRGFCAMNLLFVPALRKIFSPKTKNPLGWRVGRISFLLNSLLQKRPPPPGWIPSKSIPAIGVGESAIHCPHSVLFPFPGINYFFSSASYRSNPEQRNRNFHAIQAAKRGARRRRVRHVLITTVWLLSRGNRKIALPDSTVFLGHSQAQISAVLISGSVRFPTPTKSVIPNPRALVWTIVAA
jgi:hypothetical protein